MFEWNNDERKILIDKYVSWIVIDWEMTNRVHKINICSYVRYDSNPNKHSQSVHVHVCVCAYVCVSVWFEMQSPKCVNWKRTNGIENKKATKWSHLVELSMLFLGVHTQHYTQYLFLSHTIHRRWLDDN